MKRVEVFQPRFYPNAEQAFTMANQYRVRPEVVVSAARGNRDALRKIHDALHPKV